MNEKRFRSDLYYRLAVVDVRIPALRERRDDLPLLVETLLDQLGAKDKPAARELFKPAFVADLARQSWPGNVRELRNYLDRCLALEGACPFDRSTSQLGDGGAPAPELDRPLKVARERWSREFERQYVSGMLARHGDNVAAAARAAGIDRMYFYRLLWRHGLK